MGRVLLYGRRPTPWNSMETLLEVVLGRPASSEHEHSYCQPNRDLDGFQETYPEPMPGLEKFCYKPMWQRGWRKSLRQVRRVEAADHVGKKRMWSLNSGPWRARACPLCTQALSRWQESWLLQLLRCKRLAWNLCAGAQQKSNRPTRTMAAKGSHYIPQT